MGLVMASVRGAEHSPEPSSAATGGPSGRRSLPRSASRGRRPIGLHWTTPSGYQW